MILVEISVIEIENAPIALSTFESPIIDKQLKTT